MSEIDKLAQLIWNTSHRDEGTISTTGANIIAHEIRANGFADAEINQLRVQLAESNQRGEFCHQLHEARADDIETLERSLADAQAAIARLHEWIGTLHPAQREACLAFLSAPSSTGGAESQGVALIAAERKRQVAEEGYDAEHDAGHARDLVDAGRSYAHSVRETLSGRGHSFYPSAWPWGLKFWKPALDPVRTLVKAGSLIAAAIDSLLAKKGDDHE